MAASRPASNAGHIYFILAPEMDRVKVGFSLAYPDKRVAELQVGCPVILRRLGFLRGTFDDEHRVHVAFRRYWIHGEWFHYSERIRKFAEECLEPWPTPPPSSRPAMPSFLVTVRPIRVHTPPPLGSKYWSYAPVLPEEF